MNATNCSTCKDATQHKVPGLACYCRCHLDGKGLIHFGRMRPLPERDEQSAYGNYRTYRVPFTGDPAKAVAGLYSRKFELSQTKRDAKSATGYRGPDGFPCLRPFDPLYCSGQWDFPGAKVIDNEIEITVYDSIGD